jgi:hypothetical protein
MDIMYIDHFQLSKFAADASSSVSETTPWTGNVDDASHIIRTVIPYDITLKITNGCFNGIGDDRELSFADLTVEDISPKERVYTYLFNNAPGVTAEPPKDHKTFWSQNVKRKKEIKEVKK